MKTIAKIIAFVACASLPVAAFADDAAKAKDATAEKKPADKDAKKADKKDAAKDAKAPADKPADKAPADKK